MIKFGLNEHNKKPAIFQSLIENVLLLSLPDERLDAGALLDTSKATTPVSSLSAVDEGVVAVT